MSADPVMTKEHIQQAMRKLDENNIKPFEYQGKRWWVYWGPEPNQICAEYIPYPRELWGNLDWTNTWLIR